MSAERGKNIISAGKSLKGNQLADPTIAHYLYATSFAGRAGLFASALKQAGTISLSRAQILAETEGFTRLDVRERLLPWLEATNLVHVQRLRDKSIAGIVSLLLTYEPLLEAVAELYDSSEPTSEDRGCVQALAMVSALADARAGSTALGRARHRREPRKARDRTGEELPNRRPSRRTRAP